MKLSGLVVSLLVPGAAIAQSLTLTSLAAAPLVATSGLNTQTATLPAGPMLPNGALNAVVPPLNAGANFSWVSSTSDIEMYFGFEQRCWTYVAGSSASNGTMDLQVDLVAPQAMPVRIDLSRLTSIPAGAPGPLLRVDVGNDGIFELTEAGSAVSNMPWVSVDAQIGPTSLPVRVQMVMGTTTLGAVEVAVNVSVRPRTGITVGTAVGGCAVNEWYWVQPRFDGGLNSYAESASSVPPLMVAVFGLGAQPILLGTTPVPCLVFPSADLLLLVAPTSVLGGPVPPAPVFTLPIPPGVGPLTLWTQAVVLEPTALTTTTAFRVDLQ